MAVKTDADLTSVLEDAESEDLCLLADFITDNGGGRVALSTDSNAKLNFASRTKYFDESAKGLIAEEIQRFGGNSIANLLRGGTGVLYREIVCDVASHVQASVSLKADCEVLELAVLKRVMEQSLERMTSRQREEVLREVSTAIGSVTPFSVASIAPGAVAGGIAAYFLATMVANGTARVLLGRGLTMAAGGALPRAASILGGPVALAITAIWTAFDLASPAYRVTVPCVIQVAYMRQKANIRTCIGCGNLVARGPKFCQHCGTVLPQ